MVLVAAGAGPVATGDMVVFLKPVAIAAAVVRRDGRVQAAGHPADHARLGVAEERLDELACEADVIGQIAAAVKLGGKVKGALRRAMTPALAVRFTLLMTLTQTRTTPSWCRPCWGTWCWCRGSAGTRRRPRRWPARGGKRSGPGRCRNCGTWCWPWLTPPTATAITGRSRWGTWTSARSTGR